MDRLIIETKRYETNINTLAKIKDYFKHGHYSYMAGTLCIKTPDLINDEGYVTIDIKPIGLILDPLEQEIMYYASKMYAKYKGSGFSFYDQAISNINEYKALGHE